MLTQDLFLRLSLESSSLPRDLLVQLCRAPCVRVLVHTNACDELSADVVLGELMKTQCEDDVPSLGDIMAPR